MQLKHLTVALIGGVVASTMPAQAVMLDRTFNNGGTTISLSGSVSPSFAKTTREFTYYDPRAFDRIVFDPIVGRWVQSRIGTAQDVIVANAQKRTDERLRMNGVNYGSINLSAQQLLGSSAALFTGLDLAYDSFGGNLYNSYLGVTNTRTRDMAMIGIGFLPTRSVATSGTYNLLDDRAGSMIAGTLTRVPKLRLDGYYAFSDITYAADIEDTAMRKGYGALASYTHSFAPRNSLTGNLGISKSERRNGLKNDYVPRDKTSAMAGISYNYYNWTLGVDGGVSKSDFHGRLIQDAKTTATGVRIGYAFTPRLNGFAYYGEKTTTNNEANGFTLNYANLQKIDPSTNQPIPVNEYQFFKTIKENQYGVGVNYAYHKNLSFNARAGLDNTKYSLTDGDFAKVANQNYRLGMTLSF